MMKWFGPYTGYALQQELEHVDTPVGMPCQRCEELIEFGDTGVMIPYTDNSGTRKMPWHWNCHLRMCFGSVAHIEDRCLCHVKGSCENDDPALTRRQAADAAVVAYMRREHGR